MEEGVKDESVNDWRRLVEEMTLTQLRRTYPKENNSHRGMLDRSREEGGPAVDPAWRDFRRFMRDMGPKPKPDWSLDRIDSERREYGPGLCRWADDQTQSENRPNTRWVRFEGERITVAEFARRAQMPPSTVYAQIAAGRTPEEIVSRGGSHGYQPLELSPDEAMEWHREYRRWLETVVHPHKRDFAPPELYDLMATSGRMARADEELTAMGYYELVGEQIEQATAMEASPQAALLIRGDRRLAHAMAALRASRPDVANLLTERLGLHRLSYWRREHFLKAPRG